MAGISQRARHAIERVVQRRLSGVTRTHVSVAVTVSLLSASVVLGMAPARAQDAGDSFAISYGDTVSDGVPAPGAGNIEAGGAADSYTFEAEAGDAAIFDVLAGSASDFRWRLDAPDGGTLFDGLYVDRRVELSQTGTYTLAVRGATATTVGTYSFRLLLTPPAEEFPIGFGDTVADGVPAPGAGNLEGPGAVDRYPFPATAGQVAILDALTRSNDVRWSLHAPDGSQIFDSLYTDQQATLDQTGTYVVSVSGLTITSFGTYSFQLLQAPGVEEFTIGFGDTVSDGVPGPGAGNLEGPGAVDRYLFDASAGQVAILDALSGSTTEVRWSLQAPDGSEVFDSFFVDQQVTLDQTGTYAVTVSGVSTTSFGVYSFQLLDVPPQVDEFTIGFGDTVSDGVPGPGAGNLEGPGAIDRYLFDASAGQVATFDALSGSTTEVRWSLQAPDGSEVFDSFFVDQQAALGQTGTYTLTVRGQFITSFGVYSFALREEPVNSAPVAIDDVAETDHGVPVTIDVLGNDTDPDGDALFLDAVTPGAHGTTGIDGSQVTYTPDAGFAGIDSFTYTVADGRGGTAQATVTVTVHAPVNSPPSIGEVDDQDSTVGDQVSLTIPASDPDGDLLAYTADGLPPGLDIDPTTGEITGTIDDGAETDSPYAVDITVTDGRGGSATASFQWTVHPVSVAPVTVDIEILAWCIVNDGFGVIPVVIFGNDRVAAHRIDPATVELEGMPVKQVFGWFTTFIHDLNGDGVNDLLVLIDDVAGEIPAGATTAVVTGQLVDGTAFEGADEICLLPR